MGKKENNIDIITIFTSISIVVLIICYTYSIVNYLLFGKNDTYNSVSDFFSSPRNVFFVAVSILVFIMTLIFFGCNLKNEDKESNNYICIKKSELDDIHDKIKKQEKEIETLKKENK